MDEGISDDSNLVTDLPSAYLFVLQALAQAARWQPLTTAQLRALERLNGVFFLQGYLYAHSWQEAVVTKAYELAIAVAGAATEPDLPPGPAPTVSELIAWVDSPASLIAVQHVLEVQGSLGAEDGPVLRAALQAHLTQIRTDPEPTEVRPDLQCLAGCNQRPARPGEIAAWAGRLGVLDPHQLLAQALASGLRFGALLDSLTLAAASQLLAAPHPENAELVQAAHALRRLYELTGDAPLAGWLITAARLEPPRRAGIDPSLPLKPRMLAGQAIRSLRSQAAAVAEAALMESEAIDAEWRALPWAALDRYLRARGDAGRARKS